MPKVTAKFWVSVSVSGLNQKGGFDHTLLSACSQGYNIWLMTLSFEGGQNFTWISWFYSISFSKYKNYVILAISLLIASVYVVLKPQWPQWTHQKWSNYWPQQHLSSFTSKSQKLIALNILSYIPGIESSRASMTSLASITSTASF